MYKCRKCNGHYSGDEFEWYQPEGSRVGNVRLICPECGSDNVFWCGEYDTEGEDRAIAAMERGIYDCETNYGDRDY